jgi:ribonuclease HI
VVYLSKVFYTDGACSNNGYKNSSGGFGIVGIEDNNIIWEY